MVQAKSLAQQRWRLSHPQHKVKQLQHLRNYINRWAEYQKMARIFRRILL